MKTLQIICLSAILTLAVSCKKEPGEPAIEQKEMGTLPEVTTDSVMDPKPDAAHNSENSLDWPGTYSGTLPCGDCKGIKTDITITTDKTYSLSSQYLGKEDKPHVYKGTFAWDDAKNVITLDAEGDHLKFKVQEGSLKKLDKFGDAEQGGPASAYILNKVQ